jgi:hypothetical protein
MANSKLASTDTQIKRGTAFSKVALIGAFVMTMSIPILNLLFGMGFVIWFGVNIFARSAQRGVDFLWLFVGAVVCLTGIALPAFTHDHTSYATDWSHPTKTCLENKFDTVQRGGKIMMLIDPPDEWGM